MGVTDPCVGRASMSLKKEQVVSILELVLADMEKAYKAVEDKDIDLTTPSEPKDLGRHSLSATPRTEAATGLMGKMHQSVQLRCATAKVGSEDFEDSVVGFSNDADVKALFDKIEKIMEIPAGYLDSMFKADN